MACCFGFVLAGTVAGAAAGAPAGAEAGIAAGTPIGTAAGTAAGTVVAPSCFSGSEFVGCGFAWFGSADEDTSKAARATPAARAARVTHAARGTSTTFVELLAGGGGWNTAVASDLLEVGAGSTLLKPPTSALQAAAEDFTVEDADDMTSVAFLTGAALVLDPEEAAAL